MKPTNVEPKLEIEIIKPMIYVPHPKRTLQLIFASISFL
jgi:hypothetical protein